MISGLHLDVFTIFRAKYCKEYERDATFLGKLERGFAQVRAGHGIVKTMDKLEEMAEDGV